MQETKEVAWAVGILAVVVGLLTETLGKLHIAGAVIFTIISVIAVFFVLALIVPVWKHASAGQKAVYVLAIIFLIGACQVTWEEVLRSKTSTGSPKAAVSVAHNAEAPAWSPFDFVYTSPFFTLKDVIWLSDENKFYVKWFIEPDLVTDKILTPFVDSMFLTAERVFQADQMKDIATLQCQLYTTGVDPYGNTNPLLLLSASITTDFAQRVGDWTQARMYHVSQPLKFLQHFAEEAFIHPSLSH